MNATVNDLIERPEDFGMAWSLGNKVHTENGNVLVSDKVPLLRHVDGEKVVATMGSQYITDNLDNSQSPIVRQQNKLRPALLKGKVGRSDVEAMKRMAAEAVLNVRSARAVAVREVQVFVANDGTKFDSLEEVMEYNSTL